MKRFLKITFFFLLLIYIRAPAEAAVLFDEKFEDYVLLDPDKTSAYIDTTNHFARLPEQSLSSAIAVMKDSPGFAVATKSGIELYEYDDSSGSTRPNNIFSCPWATDATGVAVRQDNLNIWGITPNSISHYKYNGSGMSNDPNLKVTGLNNVISVAGFQDRDSAILLQRTADNKAKMTRYNAGTTLTASVTVTTDITDPVAVSMVNDSPDFHLYTKTARYYFVYDDATSSYVEDPAKKISALTEVVSGSSDDAGSSVLTTNRLDYYMNLDGGGAVQVNSFSPGPVSGAVSVSLRPGTFDQVFIDRNGQVQWWTYDDALNSMRRDAALEASGFSLNTGYVPHAEYVSKEIMSPKSYKLVRVTATVNTPTETSLIYHVSVDGTNYTPVELNQWTTIPSSNKFYLKVVLETFNSTKTPFVYNVKLEVDSPPDQPIIPVYGACFITTTPELTWTFSDPDDPDPGDFQSAYQVQVSKSTADSDIFLDSGKILSMESNYTVPTSSDPAVPGPLWGAGVYQYKYRVKVWDSADAESEWSNWGDFCVNAFERPRIAQIISPPAGQISPDPANPSTHITITQGMTAAQLPKVKAGAKVVLLVDSIGPLSSFSAAFPYLSQTATTNIPTTLPDGVVSNPVCPAGNPVNQWSVEFWTEPSLEKCPSGTLVTMKLDGNGSEGAASLYAPPYAAGVVVTEGSIYNDWFVVLQGRD